MFLLICIVTGRTNVTFKSEKAKLISKRRYMYVVHLLNVSATKVFALDRSEKFSSSHCWVNFKCHIKKIDLRSV